MNMKLSKICLLFLLGMIFIQASYSQITKVASAPVTTEYQVLSPNGIRDHTWMVENWPKLYVSYTRGIQEVDAETYLVTNTLPLMEFPVGMCLDKVSGRIATIDKKTYSNSEIPFTLTDPATKSRQSIMVKTQDGDFVSCNVCAFGTDGKTLYFGSNVQNYPQSAKLVAVDTATWKITRTWADANLVSAILPLPNGKVYFVTEYTVSYPNIISDLRVLDLDGVVKKVDLGGLMPKALNLGPNGHIYMPLSNNNLIELDPQTNEVLDSNWSTLPYLSWATNDSNYVYMAGSGPLLFAKLVDKTIVTAINNIAAHNVTAKRQSDGSDLIAILSDGRVDFYKYTPTNLPRGVIAGVSPLYYGLAPVLQTRYPAGDVLTIWGEKLCPLFPIMLQVPPPNPLKKEWAGCSVRIVDSKNNDLQGSLYFISPYQINVQFPSDIAGGIAKLSVKDTTKEGIQESSPVFLSIKSMKPNYVQYAKAQIAYLAALHNEDGALVTAERPAKAGDVIQLYAVGLGETNPKVPAGELAIAPLVAEVVIKANGIPANVLWAGLQGQYAGLYQINFIVPDGVTASELSITVTQKDGSSQTDSFVFEQ